MVKYSLIEIEEKLHKLFSNKICKNEKIKLFSFKTNSDDQEELEFVLVTDYYNDYDDLELAEDIVAKLKDEFGEFFYEKRIVVSPISFEDFYNSEDDNLDDLEEVDFNQSGLKKSRNIASKSKQEDLGM